VAHISISLGSNINPEHNIRGAVSALHKQFGDLIISPVYQTEAVGFDGEDFLNLVVCFDSELDVFDVSARLKSIEDTLGRDRSQPRFSARAIDLDLLTFDDLVMDEGGVQIPRHEILENAFVLKPLSDICADMRHPQSGSSYRELWDEMQPSAGRIERIELNL
jgi:2-amino-4-hydroxy-6-hydroxymethyldihydropteridine diphosphokinase